MATDQETHSVAEKLTFTQDMTHQPEKIPWDLLVSHLRWISNDCKCKVTNLYPDINDPKETRAENIRLFCRLFAEAIKEASQRERTKYSKSYPCPDPDDVLITDEMLRKIEPDVRSWKASAGRWETWVCADHNRAADHCSTVPPSMRKAKAFFRFHEYNDCHKFDEVNGKGFFNLEVVKTLILHGEMEPILRACAHERVGLASWQNMAECTCNFETMGWDVLYQEALHVYLCLNVAYCFPETWDSKAGRSDQTDYRQTKFYQQMLRESTAPVYSEAVFQYFRHFFGIDPDQFDDDIPMKPDEKHGFTEEELARRFGQTSLENPYGLMQINEFLFFENASIQYQPHFLDIISVQEILSNKGHLPGELVLKIMDFADYEPKRMLPVPHDPLHPANQEKLASFLENCWQILVRCDMMAKALDIEISWETLICYTVLNYWDRHRCCDNLLYSLELK
ncbi:hypothetical protein N7462_004931 [Penicillium macrosclerotiorum]|uniref:uncharacterized protein n=1 Tax=Penicillium macrosclerotiorum TaxID=303699 RepID=UPI0025485345|nr:uncharacterized protein N7462_004931 [Penicillium macrosclerotiorum]KAJ5690539.1 hypothetical protein N7462_004931 [Penicillium macrosclerotiorum]